MLKKKSVEIEKQMRKTKFEKMCCVDPPWGGGQGVVWVFWANLGRSKAQ